MSRCHGSTEETEAVRPLLEAAKRLVSVDEESSEQGIVGEPAFRRFLDAEAGVTEEIAAYEEILRDG